jgi:hypothetical protein
VKPNLLLNPKAVCNETGLLHRWCSVHISKSNHCFINSETVPVKVGEAKFALNLKKLICVAAETVYWHRLYCQHSTIQPLSFITSETVPKSW